MNAASMMSHPVLGAAAAFAVWALIACLWSADPIAGLGKVLILMGLLALIKLATNAIEQTSPDIIAALWRGIVCGLVLGAIYLSVETATSRSISKFLFNHFPSLQIGYEKHLRFGKGLRVVNVSDANINRVTAIFSLFFWPTVFAARSVLTGRLKALVLTIFAVTGVILMLYSRHQTSQLALLCSGAALGLAWLAPSATRALLAVGWVSVTALIVPLSLAAYTNGLHLSPALFNTAKARVIIWGYTAEHVLKRPMVGVGTNATSAIDKQRTALKDKPEGYASAKETRAHPHNFYLQVWYELGTIGAALFGLLGLTVLAAIRRLHGSLQPIALAQFTMMAAMIGSSYGLWQTWLQASLAFSIIALLMAMKLAIPTVSAGLANNGNPATP